MLADFAHRFLEGMSASSPTLLALHATGGDENDLIPLARLVSAGAAILSPRGRVLENGMPRFFRRIAAGVFDQDDLRARTDELASFVSDAAREYGFDPARVYAVGYANGANIAASLMLRRQALLAGGVLLRPMLPFEPDEYPDLSGKPIFISAGRDDAMAPAESTGRLADVLRRAGADVTLVWQQTGHSVLSKELDQAAEWFVQHTERA